VSGATAESTLLCNQLPKEDKTGSLPLSPAAVERLGQSENNDEPSFQDKYRFGRKGAEEMMRSCEIGIRDKQWLDRDRP